MHTRRAEFTAPVLPVTPLFPRFPRDSKFNVMGAALVILSAPGVVPQLSVSLISPLRDTPSRSRETLSMVPPESLVSTTTESPPALGVIVSATPERPSAACCALRVREITWSLSIVALNALALINLETTAALTMAMRSMMTIISTRVKPLAILLDSRILIVYLRTENKKPKLIALAINFGFLFASSVLLKTKLIYYSADPVVVVILPVEAL